MKLDFVAEKLVPGYRRINSSPLFSVCPLAGLSAGSRACTKTICSLGLLLHKGLVVSLISPAFLLFPPHYRGNSQRKKGGEKQEQALNAHKEKPAHLLLVKMCTSPRTGETACFTPLWARHCHSRQNSQSE